MLVKLAAIFFSMILVNNYVLVKFYGICPFLGVSQLSPVGFADWYSLRRRTSAGCLSKRQKRKEVPTQC